MEYELYVHHDRTALRLCWRRPSRLELVGPHVNTVYIEAIVEIQQTCSK